MTLDHSAGRYTQTPAQWADDWLTPDEARAQRAAEGSTPSHSVPAPRNPQSIHHTPAQSKLSRIVQRVCQAIAYATIALCIVGLWYIGCIISWVLSAH